ncbi:MAG: hypothetical protein BroJett030_21250 [Alphaproteobacteria bacterium]|nr:MAG: hypothetical protein BroJett030_21250 [Alphaproteobacteria bacterium]
MADFEGLIRQALARQDDSDPAIREKIYQSSRRALAKMIAGAGVQPPEIINRQRMALEQAIERIEAGYRRVSPPRPIAESRPTGERGPAPAPAEPPFEQAAPAPRGEPPMDRHAAERRMPSPQMPEHYDPRFDPAVSIGPEAGPGVGVGHDADRFDRDWGADEAGLDQTMSRTRRIIAFAALAVILAVVGWLIYVLVVTLTGLSRPSTGEAPPPSTRNAPATPAEQSAEQPVEQNATVITLLSAADTSALETAGRGTAEIVSQSNVEMIRLTSLRPEANRNVPAEPILLQLSRGVMEQIAGKRTTVEIMAKSGTNGPAEFLVDCEFAGEAVCGRKRFKAGIQAEPFLFEIDTPRQLADGEVAYLTISTDVSDIASETGQGDPIDIRYVQLRVPR